MNIVKYSELVHMAETHSQARASSPYKAVFTYKALNNLSPQYIADLLKPVSETHNRTLRSSVNGALAVPRSHSSLFDRSYSYTAPKLWNCIPNKVRNAPSLKSFKDNIILFSVILIIVCNSCVFM